MTRLPTPLPEGHIPGRGPYSPPPPPVPHRLDAAGTIRRVKEAMDAVEEAKSRCGQFKCSPPPKPEPPKLLLVCDACYKPAGTCWCKQLFAAALIAALSGGILMWGIAAYAFIQKHL